MKLFFVIISAIAVLTYTGLLPKALDFPLPLVIGAAFTGVMLFVLAKA
ncbi:MAG: hypothetical protein L3J32_07965 [Rhizobiaceae bacterium]|nr:hypothetical protein [Rhizobiaceae bacterium]